ncbi:hypothetical protein QUF70_04430 [Desulfobacterales bacterium HSG17]|nr:hypothetical protein [Desulfobacterales bacterium HSG17]
MGKNAFDVTKEYLVNSGFKDPNYKLMVNDIIIRIIKNERRYQDYFLKNLTELYRSNSNVRYSLIHGVKRITDTDIKNKIIREFQNIGIPDVEVLQEITDEILTGYEDELWIDCIEDVYNEIMQNSEKKYIAYIAHIFRKNDNFKPWFRKLLSEYGDQQLVQEFVAELLKKERNSYYVNIALDYWNKNQDDYLKRKLSEVIKEKQFRSPTIKAFVFDHDFELAKRLYSQA